MVGLNFSDENEADIFYKAVEFKIRDRQQLRQGKIHVPTWLHDYHT